MLFKVLQINRTNSIYGDTDTCVCMCVCVCVCDKERFIGGIGSQGYGG